MSRTKVIILGAAGRDFHNFNCVYRGNEAFEVVAFTATQIPDIDGRKYPAELAGDPERAARFAREARTLASLQHPHIASIYGFEEIDGQPVLVMELAEGSPPALFLLDEILHGTNSHDRQIGAAAVVRGLVERGAIGLVTTHDLALARIAEDLAPRAANVHFEDHLEDGQIAFDYRIRPGVVEKSNALALMREVGLDV